MKKVHLSKQQIAKILVAILCIAGLSSFLVYYFTPQPLVPLTAEQEMEVKESYITDAFIFETVDDLYIQKYYGTYGDCIVVRVAPVTPHITTGDPNSRIVAGCKFIGSPFFVYRNGELALLKDAYKDGWISFKDVKDIHYYYNN